MANNNKGLYTGLASGAISGAGAGSTVGPWGTLIGGLVGAAAGGIGGYENDQTVQQSQDLGQAAYQNETQFNQNSEMQKEQDERRKLGMGGLDYLAQQRALAQSNGNIRSFRNSIMTR
jgi:hypothetical protein